MRTPRNSTQKIRRHSSTTHCRNSSPTGRLRPSRTWRRPLGIIKIAPCIAPNCKWIQTLRHAVLPWAVSIPIWVSSKSPWLKVGLPSRRIPAVTRLLVSWPIPMPLGNVQKWRGSVNCCDPNYYNLKTSRPFNHPKPSAIFCC